MKIKEEFVEMIEEGCWDNFLRKVLVKKGDFYYVLSGIIYVIGLGILILEM